MNLNAGQEAQMLFNRLKQNVGGFFNQLGTGAHNVETNLQNNFTHNVVAPVRAEISRLPQQVANYQIINPSLSAIAPKLTVGNVVSNLNPMNFNTPILGGLRKQNQQNYQAGVASVPPTRTYTMWNGKKVTEPLSDYNRYLTSNQGMSDLIGGTINPSFGKIPINNIAKKFAPLLKPEDIGIIGRMHELIDSGKIKGDLGQVGQDYQRLAEHVFGKQTVAGWSPNKMKAAFDLVLGKIGEQKNNAGLGLSIGTVKRATQKISGGQTGANLKTQIGEELLQSEGQAANNPSSSRPFFGQAEQLAKGQLQQKGLPLESPLGSSIPQIPNSLDPYFNTNKLNISPQAKLQVNQVIQEVKPKIEQVVGKKLTNQQIIQTANGSSKILHKVVDQAQTQDFTARLLKTRQQLAAAADSGTVDKNYIDNLIAIKSHATDIARKLQSFNIGADPKLVTSKDAILEAVLQVEKDASKVSEAAKGVDFNDLKQATDFYRKFVKPSTGEWVDLVRYNSMLSSPITHISNAVSNLLNSAVVTPVEKTIAGTTDFLASKVTGRPQKAFIGEAPAYIKGYVSSIHDAAHAFADVLRGNKITGNLDVRQIPLSTKQSVQNLNIPTRLLEASDQFFTALTKGGEEASLSLKKAKGAFSGNVATQAEENAKYRLFRSELHDPRQGHLLNSIDDVTALIQQARSSKNPITSTIAKYTLPFVRTPMNILKQGVEYSPAGIATLPGAANKTEQIAKMLVGSSAATATAMLVVSGRTTWAEPTDPTQKAAFRAAGLQPYSIKIGNNWVQYSKLPPALGFPIAFISALHDSEEKKTLDQNQIDIILNTAAKAGNFFSDQSYLKNIGDLLAAAKGNPENVSQFISNYPQQVVPYRALLGWMARITDPYQRKINTDANFLEKQVQSLFTQIPGLSQTVPARLDKAGEPIPNQNKEINAFSPFKVSTERPQQKEYYDLLQQKSLFNKNKSVIKDKILKGEPVTFEQAAAAEESSANTSLDKITTPHALSDGEFTKLFTEYFNDDLKRNPSQQELQTAINSYKNGADFSVIQRQQIASTDEAVGFKQTPEQKQQTLNFLNNSYAKTVDLSKRIYGNPTVQQFHEIGEKVENGVPENQIINESKSTAKESQAQSPRDTLRKQLEISTMREKVKLTGQTQEANGVIAYPKDGKVRTIDMSAPLSEPKLTGQAPIDNQLLQGYSRKLSGKINDITELVQLGKLTPEEGASLVEKIQEKQKSIKLSIKTSKGKSGRPKAPPKYRVSRVSARTSQTKIARIKAPTVRLPRIKKIKVGKIKAGKVKHGKY